MRDQLVIRMSRRVGVVVYDTAARPAENATYDLRSRLRVAGGRGRLSLTLILRSEGRPVWSESYDRDTDDIFDFCDVILERAEGDLRLQTNAFDGDRLSKIPDQDLSVSELRSRAANEYYRLTYEGWETGRRLMERALKLNPSDAISLCMRAEAEVMQAAARYEDLPRDTLDRMADDVDTAIEQAPTSDYVRWTRGFLRVNCFDDPGNAELDLARSRSLNPAYLENHELEGHIRMLQERFSEAAGCFGILLTRQTHNPMLPYRSFLRACAHYCDGRMEDALADVRFAIDMRPRERALHILHALACKALGRTDEAERSLDKARQLPPEPHICSRRPVLPASRSALASALARAVRDPQGTLELPDMPSG